MNKGFLKLKGSSEISRVLGISRQTVTNFIKGSSCMSVDQAIKIARHYGVSLMTVIDSEYRAKNQDDLIAELDAENRLLLDKIKTIKSLVVDTNTTPVIEKHTKNEGECV